MTISIANISTDNASKYLQQLCKHFDHKVPVEFSPEQGQIALPFGICELVATLDTLTLKVDSGAQDIDKMERVIADHLARFAFRENPPLAWQRAA